MFEHGAIMIYREIWQIAALRFKPPKYEHEGKFFDHIRDNYNNRTAPAIVEDHPSFVHHSQKFRPCLGGVTRIAGKDYEIINCPPNARSVYGLTIMT